MKKLIFVFLLLGCLKVTGQDQANYPEQFSKLVQVPNTPEAEAFTKYGDYDVSMYSGTPNISIPLYVFKGKEMDLPISLTYDASGIKVNQIASNVGLGWNLNVGGRVSRQTRGLADHGVDLLETPNMRVPSIRSKILKYNGLQSWGLGLLDDTGIIFPNTNLTIARDAVRDYYEFLQDVSEAKIDIEQDYFSVNGMGLNDVIWMDTETYGPHALKNPNLKIVSPGENPSTFPDEDILYWEFLDEQGNRYFFGNYPDANKPYTDASNAIEIIKRTDDKDTQPIPNSNIIYNSSWLVSKIVSSNGKDIYHFNYTNNTELDIPEAPELVNQTVTHNLSHDNGGQPEYIGAGSPPVDNRISSVKSFHTKQLLESIYHNDKEIIRFELGDREDLQNGTNKSIETIKIFSDYPSQNTLIEKIEFDQTYFEPTSGGPFDYHQKRLKLDGIRKGTGTDQLEHTFDYFDEGQVPSRFSKSIDILGYFNGQSNSTAFEAWTNSNNQVELPGANREPNELKTNTGTLQRIHYPTGGFSEFEFENHTDGVEIYPGLRIKSISNYANLNTLATKTDYEYPNASISKNYNPLLHIEEQIERSPCLDNSFSTIPKTLYRYIYPPNSDDDGLISYGEVVERKIANGLDNGYIKYEFSTGNENWINSNELPFYNRYSTGASIGNPIGTEIVDKNNTTLRRDSISYGFIGSIYSDTTFVVKQNPIRQYSYICVELDGNRVEVNVGDNNPAVPETASCAGISLISWQIDSQGYESFSTGYCNGANQLGISTSGLARFEKKNVFIYANYANQISVVKTEHFGSQSKVTTSTNEYNSDGYFLSATNTSIEEGQKQRIEYTYPKDIATNDRTDAEDELIDQNKLASPIETKSKRINANATEQILSEQRTDFKIWNLGSSNEFVLPETISSKKAGATVWDDRIKIVSVDDYGNTQEAKLINGASVRYIWGYDGMYPVAKIENIENSIPSSLITAIETQSSTSGTEAGLLTALTNLRNDSSLSNAQVTTFTYQPGIGVSTVTDAKGYKMSYHYDEHNRLKYVKDADDNVLGKNEYNYRINN